VSAALDKLESWVDSGADYRVLHLSDEAAIVDLTTCTGEPMERLESSDRDLIDYVRRSSTDRTFSSSV
jgi:hypothetical protein